MKAIRTMLSMLFISLLTMGLAEGRTIHGTVTDENGDVMVGVNVIEKGTNNGCITAYDGSYKITLLNEAATLSFIFIGYENVDVPVKDQDRIDVQMIAAVVAMDEVVVVAHGEHRNYTEVACSSTVVSGISGKASGVRIRGVASPGRWHGAKRAQNVYYQPVPQWVPADRESYAGIIENGFKDVMQAPLSTFSVDVDRASYANVRRFLNMGQLPPVDAIRIEEMINYFDYDYPEPEGQHPFSVYTELSECPWNEGHQLLHVGLKGKSVETASLPPSNLVFLLDVSGSMSAANKLPLLKQSFRMLVNELRPEDRVAIVVYAGAAGLVLESTPGSEKARILAALDQLQAGGSTAGGAGINLAYNVARKHFIEGGNNRIVLATDGDFNVGASSNEAMEKLVENKRQQGIFLTVLGFGMGNIQDDKMEILADKGNGNYAYIDNLQEARKVLISEFGGTLFTIAKDVKFQIEFNPARVEAYRLVGYENRLLNDEDFNDDQKDAGEIGAGHTVTALYEIIPAGSGESRPRVDPLKYQGRGDESEQSVRVKPDPKAELMTVKLRYKQPDENRSTKVEIPVKGRMLALEESSENFRFSASVAAFGMILRNSGYCSDASLEEVVKLARTARGEDEEGYRSEFVKLVRLAESMKDWTAER